MKRLPLLLAALALLLTGCGQRDYGLSTQRIQADTEYLCGQIGDRPTGTGKERAAADWLEGRLEEAGFAKENGSLLRAPFQGLFELTSENLIAVCNPGSPGPILCVMAHYDTVEGSPGARDNTSSVAVLLELARYLGPERPELKGEIRLLFLGSEENGYHGASAYVEGLGQEERERHLAAFNMENSAASPGPGAILTCATLGGVVDGTYQEGNFLEPTPNLASRALSQASQALGGEPLPLFHRGMSDHVIFHEAGLEAAVISWRFLDSDGLITVPPEYHLPDDVPETMDFHGGVTTGACILRATEELLGELPCSTLLTIPPRK